MKSEVSININDKIKVKLTDYGKELYRGYLAEINALIRLPISPRVLEFDENGYTTFQLWEFMNIFGSEMFMGNKNIIEDNEIIYEYDKYKQQVVGEPYYQDKRSGADTVKFNIEATMQYCWANHFCSLLREMERCGNIGHCSMLGFLADGDGTFRPRFNIDLDYEQKQPKSENTEVKVEKVYSWE